MKSSSFSIHRFLLKLIGYLIIAWGIGFALFWIRLPYAAKTDTTASKSDAVIVLTGGPNRLETGITLLENKVAGRMLISGVHEDVRPSELAVRTGANPDLFACCIDLGYAADSTIGNAQESAEWVHKNSFQTILLVTSDYHIQRSLILFRKHLPDTSITAVSVPTKLPVLKLAKEYNKYLITLVREGLSL
ncbi:YdcF family protein [Kordiimonas laminariae]|uniref:YdcF family protein n=1 Tax=Kordiimonas laminariae TaxID=2917717 RepID=UPI001FF38CC3|nr:YdcF family protein [Kordiimonas laminariae]MCK0069157.1 YdcF family protein [Kordiimonas laminariae]